MWFISGPALMRTAVLLTLENQADTWTSYIGESSRYLEARSENIIPHLLAQYALEAIHVRRNNPTLNCNIAKLKIAKIFNQILGTTHTTSIDVSTNSNAQQNPSFSHSNRTTRVTN